MAAYREPTFIRPAVRRDNIAMMLVPELESLVSQSKRSAPGNYHQRWQACPENTRLKLYWADAEGEDKRILAHSLFEEIVYDMDGRQIIDFKVKAWAEPFLIYRAELLEDSEGEETKNRQDGGSSNDVLSHDPNGLSPLKSLQMRRLNRSVCRILGLLYPFPGTITIADRNVLIKQRFEAGEALTDIAVDFNISPQRVWQIVRAKDKK